MKNYADPRNGCANCPKDADYIPYFGCNLCEDCQREYWDQQAESGAGDEYSPERELADE